MLYEVEVPGNSDPARAEVGGERAEEERREAVWPEHDDGVEIKKPNDAFP